MLSGPWVKEMVFGDVILSSCLACQSNLLTPPLFSKLQTLLTSTLYSLQMIVGLESLLLCVMVYWKPRATGGQLGVSGAGASITRGLEFKFSCTNGTLSWEGAIWEVSSSLTTFVLLPCLDECKFCQREVGLRNPNCVQKLIVPPSEALFKKEAIVILLISMGSQCDTPLPRV